MKKDKSLNIHLTSAEYAEIEAAAKAAGISKGEYCRKLIAQGIEPPVFKIENADLFAELRQVEFIRKEILRVIGVIEKAPADTKGLLMDLSCNLEEYQEKLLAAIKDVRQDRAAIERQARKAVAAWKKKQRERGR